MTFAPAQTYENLFLKTIPETELEYLKPHLQHVYLAADETVYDTGDLISTVYFPLNCVLSAVALMNDGAMVEVSMAGKEAVVGIITIFGDYEARNWNRVLIPGDALRMRGDTLRRLFQTRPELQFSFMSAYRALITQVSQRAVCNGRHTILQRLSTWLLMVHDRVGGDDLQLTQELISHRLGSRRAGITQAANALQQFTAISYKRGLIHISSREILEQMSCECYAVHRSEFERLGNRVEGDSSRAKMPPYPLASRRF